MPFQIVRNDITKMKVDAIVNTANPLPVYGDGIDTAVYEAAGADKLLEKRREIGVLEPGQSAVTEGFNLPAKYIIHTVGTPWRGGNEGEEEIVRNCYRSVFSLAKDHGFETIAVPLLASGSYGFPKGIALRIAMSETEAFLKDNEMEIYLVVFDEKSFALSAELYGDIDEYINDNYVEIQSEREYTSGAPEEKRRSRFRGFARNKASFELREETSASEASFMMDHASVRDSAVMTGAVPMMGAVPMAKKSLEDVVKNLDKTFMELVFSFADERGFTDPEVQKRANIDRKAFSKLKCGTTKNPSKSTALAFAVALKLNLDETKDLLSRAGFALSPCSRQDLIVQYFIEKEVYDMYEINLALFEHGESILGAGS
ncbi:MAG: macro domain-containing protein [Lachnospiraceae bacterium]|nr:macro domain-containing protein [Lachnospiraceae bacterium]